MRMIRKFLLSGLPALIVLAGAPPASAGASAPEAALADERPSYRHVTQSAVWLPAASALLPGFGQFWHGEASAWAYTGTALGGAALILDGASAVAGDFSANPTEGIEDWSVRKVLLGSLAIQGSGFMSAYSSFRTSVPAFQAEQGKYQFLTGEESLGDIFLSPFRFGHLKKTTSWLPLGALAGLVAYFVAEERSGRDAEWLFSADDPIFAGLISYNAGVTEEAAFRGWLLPLAYETLGETWWAANGAQALLFGAAHYHSKRNPVPWPQALMGWYTGYLTRKNGWTLSEAVFVHFWWDAILLNGLYLTLHEAPAASFRVELPLPL
jgi:membrane protease YdiL (CAAX protease family)